MKQQERLEEISRALEKEARNAGLSAIDFDRDVHDQKGEEAAEINNRGLRAQLKYLLSQSGSLEAGLTHLRRQIKNRSD